MSDLFGQPRPGFGWARPSPVESQRVRDDDMPVVLVAGLGAGWPPQVRLDLVRVWRELGRPVVVAVSVWEAKWAVGRQAERFAADHAVCGIRWQLCITRPDRVTRVLAYEGARRPATAWYQEAA